MEESGIKKILEKAVSFLIQSRNKDCQWSDFLLPSGESDGWVTGYVGSVLSSLDEGLALQAAREAWVTYGYKNFFSGHGGWSFNNFSPEDADSTAWGIRFARNLGLGDKLRTQVAERFLLNHLRKDGGIATFVLENELRAFLHVGEVEDISGWMDSHACVTAAAAAIPVLNERLNPWLLDHQLPDGSWDAYWWEGHEYSSSLAVEALNLGNSEQNLLAINKCADNMVSRLHGNGFISNSRFPNGSPFATALALKILVMSGKAHKQKGLLYAVVSWLLRKQKEDGSWESSAVLRVPAARITDPSSFHKWNSGTGANWGTITLDPHAIFTTATVVSALGLFGLKTILPNP